MKTLVKKSTLLIMVLLFLTIAGAIKFLHSPLNLPDQQDIVAVPPTQKTILLLFPYQINFPQTRLAEQTIRSKLNNTAHFSFDLYYEYMDVNRFADEAYQLQLVSLYRFKYSHKPVDLVFVLGEEGLKFWLDHHTEILPNPPVIVFNILPENVMSRQLPAKFTAISAEADYIQSVRWILQARPTINQVVLVRGVGESDLQYLPPINALKEALAGQVRIEDWSDLSLSEVEQRAAALPQTAVILYSPMLQDAAGVKHLPSEALRKIATVSAVPVISGYDHFIGTGTIGGYMYSVEQQTDDAIQTGLHILRGELAAAKVQSNNRFVFDHPALHKYGIPLSALPPGSVVKNRQYSLWERYQPQVLALIVFFAVLTLLMGFLIGVNQKLTLARHDLKRLNAGLDAQVHARTTDLSQTNKRLEAEISERIHAEEALRASETRYRMLADNAPMAVMVVDLQTTHMVYLNTMTATLFESTVAEMLNTSVLDYYVNSADRQLLLEKLFAHGYVQDFELRLKKKSGQEFWGSLTSTLTTFENRPATNSILQDITERKRAEQALRDSEARYRLLADNMADVIWIMDTATQKFTYVSPSVQKLRGYTPEEVMTQPVSEALTPESAQQIAASLAINIPQFLGSHQTTISHISEVDQPHADGSIVHTEVTTTFLRDEQGQVKIIGVSRDINARKQIEAERERLIGELQAALAKVNQLEGILPICSFCKRIQDENGHWQAMEVYISNHSEAEFSHGFCPDCGRKHYPQYFGK